MSSHRIIKTKIIPSIFITLMVVNELWALPADLSVGFASPNDLSPASKMSPNGGVTSFALPAEEKNTKSVDSYYMANINYSYLDGGELKEGGGEIGKYGEGKMLNVSGKLIHVASVADPLNHTGCSDDFNTKQITDEPWVALIKRGYCNFEVKVKHAYAFGAVGVIIYNDKDATALDKMKIDDKKRDITAVFISKKNGEEMVKLINMGYTVNVRITEGTKCFKPGNINRTSVLFVSISFIVLMIISLVWLIFYYVQRFRYLQTKDKQSRRLCNVAKRIIAKIPTKSIKAEDKEVDVDCCAICIEPYKVSDLIRVLPCKHEYHKNCIDPWLLEHRTCPMCKMDILKHYGFVFTGSQESILELDLDAEIGDEDGMSISSPRRDSVSPLPQIRSMDHQLSHGSSMDSDSEHEISSPNETTPSLKRGTNSTKTKTESSTLNNPEVCVGCIAAALTKHHPLNDSESSNSSVYRDETMNGPSSLPSTLKKYKGHHSTGSCRGIKNHHQHHHHHQPHSSSNGGQSHRSEGHSLGCREKCDKTSAGDYEMENTSK